LLEGLMSKTIEEILKRKPEARPRIYVYLIDAAHLAAPTARANPSQGNALGWNSENKSQPWKGGSTHVSIPRTFARPSHFQH
jgi:hypothetical protein